MSEERIIADFETMVRQAPMLTHDIMREGANNIDRMFGQDYSKKHPELLAAYMHCSMIDFSSGVLAQQLRAGLDGLSTDISYALNASVGPGLQNLSGVIDGFGGSMINAHRDVRDWLWEMIRFCKPFKEGRRK